MADKCCDNQSTSTPLRYKEDVPPVPVGVHSSGTDSPSDGDSHDEYDSQEDLPSNNKQSPGPRCDEDDKEFVEVSFSGNTKDNETVVRSEVNTLSPDGNTTHKITQSHSSTDKSSMCDSRQEITDHVKSEREMSAPQDKCSEAKTDDSDDNSHKPGDGSFSPHLTEEGKVSAQEATDDNSDILAAKFPNPFLMGPHMPFQPRNINPQNPMFMLPQVPQPFLVLPHQMATQARWPFLPIPQKKAAEEDFVGFSALTTAAATHGAMQEQTLPRIKRKMRKQAAKQDNADSQLVDPEVGLF